MAKRTSRPGRTLLIFVLGIGVLYGLAALGGTWKPQLGLDLEGGTRITLTATGHPGQTKLNQARDIVERRVNGSGVVETNVTTQGGKNIVVEIPGKNRQDLVDAAQRTAQLRFRVVATGSPQPGILKKPSPSSSPTAQPSAKPSAKPRAKPSKPAKARPSATPKSRPAPPFGVRRQAAADKTRPGHPQARPTTKPSAKPSGKPSASPTAAPTTPATTDSSDPITWASSPPAEWLKKLATYQCPASKEADKPIADDPKQPLITCDDKGEKFLLSKAVIEGTQLKNASYGTPQGGVGWVIQLAFKGSARKTFGDITTALHGNGGQFAIVLDGKVISYAGVEEPILDGNAQITGSFTESEARSLANSLKFGALPVRFENPPTVVTVGPSLAGNQLTAGVYAGIVGLLIVMLYCLLYYRGLGIVVISSLCVAAIITYATVLILAKAAGFTLTLPGIAGLIVAVGITADSFIVYFERIRDEMREGKSMRVATEAGWIRARTTCLAADGVSFLAAIVLYIFAIGVVKGFAFTLGVSTLIDIVVFFFFTKPVITLMARRRFFNSGSRFSGLSKETLGIDDDGALAGGRA